MGACTVKSSHTHREVEAKLVIPESFYFSRSMKALFSITNKKVVKCKFAGKFKAFSDSAIGVLQDGKILIVGGSDSSQALTTQVFLIDPATSMYTEMPRVPKPTKGGQLLEYKSCYYFIGATVDSEDVNSSTVYEGAPLMRYSAKNFCWEIFNHHENSTEINEILNRKVTDKEIVQEVHRSKNQTSLKHLISPGAFLWEDRIFLVGGRLYSNGTYQLTDKVFSIGLKKDEFDIREESFKMPCKIADCICAANTSQILVLGGTIENSQQNIEMFKIRLHEKDVINCDIKLDAPLEESYPPVYKNEQVIFFSFPRLLTKFNKEDKIHSFRFNKIDEGELGEIGCNPKIAGNPYIKRNVNLNIAMKNTGEEEEEKKGKPNVAKKANNSESGKGKAKFTADVGVKAPKIMLKGDGSGNNAGKVGIEVPKGKIGGKVKIGGSSSSDSKKKGKKVNAKIPSGKIKVEFDSDKEKLGKGKIDVGFTGSKMKVGGKVKDSGSSSSLSSKQKKIGLDIGGKQGDFNVEKISTPSFNVKKGKGNNSSSSSSKKAGAKVKIGGPAFEVPKGNIQVKLGKRSGSSSSSKGKAKLNLNAGKLNMPKADVGKESGKMGGLNVKLGGKVKGSSSSSSKNRKGIKVVGKISPPKVEMKGEVPKVEAPKIKVRGKKSSSSASSSSSKKGKAGLNIGGKVNVPKIEAKVEAPKAKIENKIEVPKGKIEVPKIKLGGKKSSSSASSSSSKKGKAGLNIGGKMNMPKIEAKVEAPKAKLDAKIEVPKGKIEAPKINLGGKGKGSSSSSSSSSSKKVKGGINIGGKINAPKIEAKVEAPKVKLDAKIEVPKGKIEAPKINLGGKGKGSSSSSSSSSSKKVKGGINIGGKINAPKIEAKVEVPKAKIEVPKAKIEAPKINLGGKGSSSSSSSSSSKKAKGGMNLGGKINAPKIEAKVEVPKTKIEGPKGKIEAPKAKIEAPKTNLGGKGKGSSSSSSSSNSKKIQGGSNLGGKVNLPKIEAKVEVPKAKLENKIEAPKGKIEAPKIKIGGKSSSSSSSSSSQKAKGGINIGGKINAPKIDAKVGLPKAEAPNMKLSGKGKVSSSSSSSSSSKKAKIVVDLGGKINTPKIEAPKAKIEAPKIKIGGKKSSSSSSSSSPKGKVGMNLGGKINAPKVESKIEAPKTKIEAPKAKIEAPKINLGGKGSSSSSSSSSSKKAKGGMNLGGKINAPKIEAKVEVPKAKIEAPKAKIEAPKINLGGKGKSSSSSSSSSIKAKGGINLGGKINPPKIEAKIEAPKAKIEVPKGKIEAPKINLGGEGKGSSSSSSSSSSKKAKGGMNFGGKIIAPNIEAKIEAPKAKIEAPKAKIEAPKVNIGGKGKGSSSSSSSSSNKKIQGGLNLGGKVNMPKIEAKVEAPKVKLENKIEAPKGKIEAPKINLAGKGKGSSSSSSSSSSAKGKGGLNIAGKISAPKLASNIGAPQAKIENKLGAEVPEVNLAMKIMSSSSSSSSSSKKNFKGGLNLGGNIAGPKIEAKIDAKAGINASKDKINMPKLNISGKKSSSSSSSNKKAKAGVKLSAPKLGTGLGGKAVVKVEAPKAKIQAPKLNAAGKAKKSGSSSSSSSDNKGKAGFNLGGKVNAPKINANIGGPGANTDANAKISGKVDIKGEIHPQGLNYSFSSSSSS